VVVCLLVGGCGLNRLLDERGESAGMDRDAADMAGRAERVYP